PSAAGPSEPRACPAPARRRPRRAPAQPLRLVPGQLDPRRARCAEPNPPPRISRAGRATAGADHELVESPACGGADLRKLGPLSRTSETRLTAFHSACRRAATSAGRHRGTALHQRLALHVAFGEARQEFQLVTTPVAEHGFAACRLGCRAVALAVPGDLDAAEGMAASQPSGG